MYCLLSFCCVCLNDQGELHSLSNTDVDNVQLLDKLNYCAFENEWIQSNFPIFICYKCCHNLRIAYEFKKMCHKNNKLLRGYVHQMNTPESIDYANANRNQFFKNFKHPTPDSKSIQDTVIAQYCKTELNFTPNVVQQDDNLKEISKTNAVDVNYLTKSNNNEQNYYDLNLSDEFQCNYCNRSFNQKTHLEKHLLCHTTKKPHNCTLCNKTFSRKLHLERHLLTHSGKRSHHCTLCSKSFILKSHLNGHMLTHSGIKSHNCNLCNKNFARKSDLHRHMLIHTVEKSYSCSFCHKSFARKSHLARHMIFHSGKRPHQCSLCSKNFILKSHLNDHMLTHSGIKSHHCTLCIKSFGRKSDLNRHMLTHTPKIPNFSQNIS